MKNYQDIDYSASKLEIFASFIKPHAGVFALDMLLSVLIAVIDLVFPYVSRWSMNELLPGKLFRAFFIVMAVMFVSYILKAVLHFLVTVIGHGMGTMVEADMREAAFAHLQKLSFSYYDKNRTGVLMARVTTDLFEIVELSHHGPENILTCSLTIFGAVIILFTVNPVLSLVILVMIPACLMFTMKQRMNMGRASREVKTKTGDINAQIESSISGIRTTKAFANEAAERSKFHEVNNIFRNAKKGYYRAMGWFGAGVEATVGIMQVAVISVGGYFVMKGQMDYVDLITFTLYVSTFTSPVRKLAQFMEIYTQGMAGFDRFVEIMRTEADIEDRPDARAVAWLKGDISFENVDFAYNEKSEVLKNVNMNITAGSTLALVGPSGEGKTTICSLIMRFYDVTAGRITVDGMDIRDITQDSLRQQIGIIQQDIFMFAGTVMDNIRYGRPGATDEEVMEAAKRASIHEEIMEMPEGYESYVGERGVVLSGGQKQRISIARVFLKNPPILILDEATSALDSVTEARIQHSLDELSRGRTCIIIAHRLSTVRNADNIAVVGNKGIMEYGSRQELLDKNGIYTSLEKAQEIGLN